MTERQQTTESEQMLTNVLQQLEAIRQDIQALRGELQLHRRESAQERRVLHAALELVKEDADFYNVQFVSAFTRLSDKVNALAPLAIQLSAAGRRVQEQKENLLAESEQAEAEPIVIGRRPRSLPQLRKPEGN